MLETNGVFERPDLFKRLRLIYQISMVVTGAVGGTE